MSTDHRQELFDKVSKHLLMQNKRAVRPNPHPKLAGTCMYRTDDGLMCAVGCLITEEHYDPSIEGMALSILDNDRGDVLPVLEASLGYKLKQREADLLCDMQALHDNIEPENWYDELNRIAFRHGVHLDA